MTALRAVSTAGFSPFHGCHVLIITELKQAKPVWHHLEFLVVLTNKF